METKVLTLTDFLLARISDDRFHVRNLASQPDIPADLVQRLERECEAKRRIVEMTTYDAYGFDEVQKLLALPYADHPDYREEWRPA